MTFQMGTRPTGLIRGSRGGRTGSEGESERVPHYYDLYTVPATGVNRAKPRSARIREFELTQVGLELAEADVVVKPWLPSVTRGGGLLQTVTDPGGF